MRCIDSLCDILFGLLCHSRHGPTQAKRSFWTYAESKDPCEPATGVDNGIIFTHINNNLKKKSPWNYFQNGGDS